LSGQSRALSQAHPTLRRRPAGKALMPCTIYGFLAAMQDMQIRMPQA
jgi:hypothetical protein